MSNTNNVSQIITESQDLDVKTIWLYSSRHTDAPRIDVVNGQRKSFTVSEDEFEQVKAWYIGNGFVVVPNFSGYKAKRTMSELETMQAHMLWSAAHPADDYGL